MTRHHDISRKHLLLLFLYGVIIFGVFCLALFPKERIIRQALYRVSERSSYLLSAKELLVAFPGQVELKNLTVTRKDSRAEAEGFPHLQIDAVRIKPRYSQLFLKKLALLFDLELYQGKCSGVTSFDLLQPHYLKELDCLGQGIQLASLKQIRELFNIHINGQLSGKAKLQLDKNDIETLSGDYSFEVAPGDIQVMSFPGFSFRQINGQGSLSHGKIRIRSMRIQGDDLQAQITGDLQLDKNIAKSYLKVKVNLKISQGMKEKLGPLANFLPPQQDREGIQLTIRGNLDNLSFLPT